MSLQINTFNKSLLLHQGPSPLKHRLTELKKTTETTNWGHTYTNTRIITVDNS
jgi:hypothetical protein